MKKIISLLVVLVLISFGQIVFAKTSSVLRMELSSENPDSKIINVNQDEIILAADLSAEKHDYVVKKLKFINKNYRQDGSCPFPFSFLLSYKNLNGK